MNIEEDLIEFIRTGIKVGEDSFRAHFGFCPRKLLRMLVEEGIVYKDHKNRKVSYELAEHVFIQENKIPLGELDLDAEETLRILIPPIPKPEPPQVPPEKIKKGNFSQRLIIEDKDFKQEN